MRITLITATYNSVATLNTCLQSVRGQDYPHIEHLIMDGGSTDGTLELLRNARRDQPNMLVYSQPDKGIYDALNNGIQKASGEVIGFIHSDDFLADPGIIGRVVTRFKEEDADGIYGDLLYVHQVDTKRVIRNWKGRPFARNLVEHGWMPAHPTFFLKRQVYEKHGGFDLTYSIAADYDFMLRILQDHDYSFAYFPEVITKMRVGGVSNRSLKNIVKKSREDFRAMRSNGLRYPAYTLLAKNLSKLPQFFSTGS